METVAHIPSRAGLYEVIKYPDGSFEIHKDGASIHGTCSADDVIAWFSNALFSAEYMLMKKTG